MDVVLPQSRMALNVQPSQDAMNDQHAIDLAMQMLTRDHPAAKYANSTNKAVREIVPTPIRMQQAKIFTCAATYLAPLCRPIYRNVFHGSDLDGEDVQPVTQPVTL